MKLKKEITQGVYWSSLLCAVVRHYSTGLVLLGGNPPPAVVAFLPRPPAAASCGRRHDASCRRAHHHTVSRIGRRFQCRHPVLQGRRRGGGGWEGDDVRMWTRWRRKLRRRLLFQGTKEEGGSRTRTYKKRNYIILYVYVSMLYVYFCIFSLQRLKKYIFVFFFPSHPSHPSTFEI